jgi:hypothetical protein
MVACHPAFRGSSALDDPWAEGGGVKTADAEVGAYMEAHPELLAQAAGHMASRAGRAAVAGAVVSANPFYTATDQAAAPPKVASSGVTKGANDDNPFK